MIFFLDWIWSDKTLERIRSDDTGRSRTVSTDNTPDALRLNERELCAEYSLGIISPKRSRMNVSITVSTRNSIHSAPNTSICENARSSSRIMATLTRLLAVSIVARRRSESESSDDALRQRGESSSEIRFSSSGESEKNDVSDADTNPDKNKRSRAVTIAMTDPADGILKPIGSIRQTI